jgi:hypothetical protein
MIEVRLDMEEWQRVLAILAQAPWSSVNQIIMKVGQQLQAQAQQGAQGGRSDGAGADPTSASAH